MAVADINTYVVVWRDVPLEAEESDCQFNKLPRDSEAEEQDTSAEKMHLTICTRHRTYRHVAILIVLCHVNEETENKKARMGLRQ